MKALIAMLDAYEHRFKHGHMPEYMDLAGFHRACKKCVFKGGPRRPLPALKFAWAPRPVGS